jgi:hypothetical protein
LRLYSRLRSPLSWTVPELHAGPGWCQPPEQRPAKKASGRTAGDPSSIDPYERSAQVRLSRRKPKPASVNPALLATHLTNGGRVRRCAVRLRFIVPRSRQHRSRVLRSAWITEGDIHNPKVPMPVTQAETLPPATCVSAHLRAGPGPDPLEEASGKPAISRNLDQDMTH